MAPRQAFPNHDLIPYILEHLQPPEHLNRAEFVPTHLDVARGKPWKTLASCARTSRAFSEPALRLLWRELPSLLPLFSVCLSLIEVKTVNRRDMDGDDDDDGDDVMTSLWVADDGLTQAGLQRLKHFAALVRRISLPSWEHIDPTVFFHLSRANKDRPLLPMVHQIKCRSSPHLDMAIVSLAGHSLRELIILKDHDASWNRVTLAACAVKRLLGALPSRTPGLHSLCVYDRGIHELYDIECIGDLPELRSLRLEFWADFSWLGEFVYALAELVHLYDLALPLDSCPISPHNTPMPNGFPQLRRLRFSGHHRDDLKGFASLSKVMPPIRLEHLDVVAALMDNFTENHSHLDDFIAACADTLSTVKLDIHAHEEENPYPNLPTPVPAFNFLRPLLPLRCLRVCTIAFVEKLSFTDDVLRKIRGVWPLLETFTLSWHSPYMEHPTASLRGIVEFVRECPRLTVFKISAVCVEGTRKSRTVLKALPSTFVVEDEHIRDPVALADILRGLFPVLRIGSKVLEGGSGKWGMVLSRLRDNVEGGD